MQHNLIFDDAIKSANQFTLLLAAKAGTSIYENEFNKIKNNKHNRENNGNVTLQKIFIDNWNDFLDYCSTNNFYVRETILDEIDKMIHCKDFSKGYLCFDCPNCDNYHIQGFSCHSRFCTSCGKVYRDARALEASNKCINVAHRHITWTIDSRLRKYIKEHDAYDELFWAVDDVLKHLIIGKSKKAEKEGRTLGYMSFIHTFGRDIKYNPHIHTLVAECTLDYKGNKKMYNYFPYEVLRKSFMRQICLRLTNLLRKKLINADIDTKQFNEFKQLVNTMYKEHKNGFYVHAPNFQSKNIKQTKKIINYVLRYAGHPAISETRITSYNKETKMIEYYYDPHEDDAILYESDKIGRQYVKEHVFDFIKKLIRHIPNKGVHTSRYYGFYANKSKIDISKLDKVYLYKELNDMKQNLKWQVRLLASYKYDPLLCHCGTKMKLNMGLSWFP